MAVTSTLDGNLKSTSGPSALKVKQLVFFPTSTDLTILAAKVFAFSSSLPITNEFTIPLAMLE